MKKRLTALLLVCAMVLGTSVQAATTTTKYTAKDALTGETVYADTFEQIVAAVAEGSVVRLQKTEEDNITVTKNLQLELNGNSVTGMVAINQGVVLSVSDAATADYNVSDGKYGRIRVSGEGTVVGAAATDKTDVYLKIPEGEEYLSFHAVDLNVDEMVLKTEKQGLYFKHQFKGDDMVKSLVKSYGIAFSLNDAPGATDLQAEPISVKDYDGSVQIIKAGDVIYTKYDCEVVPFGMSDAKSTSIVIKDIMTPDNGKRTNQRNASKLIKGRAFIELAEDEYVLGVERQRSLRQQVELASASWDDLTDLQKSGLLRYYRNADFNRVIKTWDVPTLIEAAKVDTTVNAEDEALLDALYANRDAYHGELHDHADTGGSSDGRQTLATWKSMMPELGMDFATILDHRQFLHMELPDWDDEMFIGGSEAAGVITDRPAGSNNYHYDMVFADMAAAERVVEAFPEFGYKLHETGDWAGGKHFTYPRFTADRFNQLITKIKEEGGLFSIAHPSSSNKTVPENALDLYFQDYISFMVFYGYHDTDNHNSASNANYKLWTDMLAAGKRIWATAGNDNHNYPEAKSLSTVYSESKKGSDHMTHLRVGDFTAGAVGVRMCVGDTAMGSTGTFKDQRLVFTVGDFHDTLKDRTFKVTLLDDIGTVFKAEMTGNEVKTFAIDADSSAKFYRVEIYDQTTKTLAALGNPIWNAAMYQD